MEKIYIRIDGMTFENCIFKLTDLYNLGRLISYTIIGGLVGLLGSNLV